MSNEESEYDVALNNPPIDIPKGWGEIPLRYGCEINPESLSGDEPPQKEIEYVDISSVNNLGYIENTQITTIEEAPSRAQRLVQDGDTIVSTVRTYLKAIAHIENPPDNMVVSTGFAVFRPSPRFHEQYLRWLIQSEPYIGWIVGNSKGVSYPAISSTELGRLIIPVPPKDVQRNICSYLEEQISNIDSLIRCKKQLINQLEGRKQSVTTEAITGQSGKSSSEIHLNQLNDLPNSWETSPLKYQVKIYSGSTPSRSTPEFWDGEIPWVTAEDMKEETIEQTEDQITEKAVADTGITLLPSGTVIVLLRGMILDHTFPVGVLGKEGYLNQDAKAMRPTGDLTQDFLFRMLQGMAPYVLSIVEESSHGTKKIDTRRFKNMVVPIPPEEEQKRIVKSINSEIEKISEVSESIKTSIDKLEEKRQAIITAAVTGQIDVSDVKNEAKASHT